MDFGRQHRVSSAIWAIRTCRDHLEASRDAPSVILLTDADIAHGPTNLSALMKKMVNERADLVSVMMRLGNQRFWEHLLIPPFVFFFQMLCPLLAVYKASKKVAADAGGCVFLRRDALRDAGRIDAVRGAL